MLYVTTRINQDAFTAGRALTENRGPGGGFFVPMHLPRFDAGQIMELRKRTFSQNVADIVNLLFGTKLDSWAIEFAIGRYPVKLAYPLSRTIVAETWHNPAWRFERLARGVEKAIRQSDQICPVPTDWLMIGSRIAVLFGVFGELLGSGQVKPDQPIHVAVPNGNFSAPMAAWYARELGLPIATILCCCNENGGTWNFLHKGEIRTDAVAVKTDTPQCDFTVPPDLERLIFGTLGLKTTIEFCETCRKGGSFYLEPHQLQTLRKGMYATVVSQRKMESTILSLYSNRGYLADPYTALCFGGVSNFRSAAGESGQVLILSEESPSLHLPLLARCLGTTAAELKKEIDKA